MQEEGDDMDADDFEDANMYNDNEGEEGYEDESYEDEDLKRMQMEADQIIEETGFDSDMVLRFVQLIDRNEYKRKQAAPGLKITSRAFGVGRRMPMAQRYDNRKTLQE